MNQGLSSVPSHERHFYAVTQAFGRFGMRVFPPQVMPASHRHGHVEANLFNSAGMTYACDGCDIRVPRAPSSSSGLACPMVHFILNSLSSTPTPPPSCTGPTRWRSSRGP
jgi:hypothetical protein